MKWFDLIWKYYGTQQESKKMMDQPVNGVNRNIFLCSQCCTGIGSIVRKKEVGLTAACTLHSSIKITFNFDLYMEMICQGLKTAVVSATTFVKNSQPFQCRENCLTRN
ncbi:hypothetical protein LOAG_04632 [Loa loa]|uniref:Uncharacterized protein n=1 Tax=Loa loa TaxID=7209 RepID=A0A1S0U2H7_LOALO|nr:hypothetical protein LOAG_04632 [Loa loa]EFO23854.1 hypothetical protein LOAG_04632 [Loa loa]